MGIIHTNSSSSSASSTFPFRFLYYAMFPLLVMLKGGHCLQLYDIALPIKALNYKYICRAKGPSKPHTGARMKGKKRLHILVLLKSIQHSSVFI